MISDESLKDSQQIPAYLSAKIAVLYFVNHPILFIAYINLLILSKLQILLGRTSKLIWDTSLSSKNLR